MQALRLDSLQDTVPVRRGRSIGSGEEEAEVLLGESEGRDGEGVERRDSDDNWIQHGHRLKLDRRCNVQFTLASLSGGLLTQHSSGEQHIAVHPLEGMHGNSVFLPRTSAKAFTHTDNFRQGLHTLDSRSLRV
ncbi:hypothetical protein BLNAU_16637 [Blattamonas nauphoetae]|uniref:Uncharacterized protein n=1 Tax=Blattamonas nauphoetae TaxID=2049346 RepID=A0ABQ9X883_9EUKA|nr:hypothetical protein BLNAU_16637 [Blattamonas nauphoetae]